MVGSIGGEDGDVAGAAGGEIGEPEVEEGAAEDGDEGEGAVLGEEGHGLAVGGADEKGLHHGTRLWGARGEPGVGFWLGGGLRVRVMGGRVGEAGQIADEELQVVEILGGGIGADGGIGGGGLGSDVDGVHGVHVFAPLTADGGWGSGALGGVAGEAATEAEVFGGIDEEAEGVVALLGATGPEPETFDEDDAFGIPAAGWIAAGVEGEVVVGNGDGTSGADAVEAGIEEFPIDGVGGVEVDAVAAGGGEGGEVAVEVVEGDNSGVGMQALGEMVGEP